MRELDAQLLEQPPRLVGVAMPNALDRLDLDLVAAAGGDPNVAGDVLQIERAVGADLERLHLAIGLLGPLTGLLVPLEPGRPRMVVDSPATLP